MTEPLIISSEQNISSSGTYDQNQQIPQNGQTVPSEYQCPQPIIEPIAPQPYPNPQTANEQIAPQPYPNPQTTPINGNLEQNNQVYQNQPYIPSNELGPINKENSNENLSYGYSVIFAIYAVQSLIYIGIDIFGRTMPEIFNNDVMSIAYCIFGILCLGLFIAIRKYNEKYECSKYVTLFFILFFVFKITFFISFYYYFMGIIKIEYPQYNTQLFFSNCATGVIYIALFIYSHIKKDINLLISFGIAFVITLIFFASLFPLTSIELAIFVAVLVLIEIVILFISIFVANYTKILEEDNPIHNSLMIDYYKFFLLMASAYLIIILYILMLVCACYILGFCCQSRPTYRDKDGNILDQYGRNMGIRLKKRPYYVSPDGKTFYDKNHNEIKEETCQIF